MKWLIGIVVATVVVGSAGPGHAQVAEKKALTLEGARQIIATAIGEARRVKAPGGVIAVVDDGGNLMALERLDGTFAAGANISIGKARTAALFKRPTKAFQDALAAGGEGWRILSLEGAVAVEGGLPLIVGGKIIGAIGASGGASQQDGVTAAAGAGTLK